MTTIHVDPRTGMEVGLFTLVHVGSMSETQSQMATRTDADLAHALAVTESATNRIAGIT